MSKKQLTPAEIAHERRRIIDFAARLPTLGEMRAKRLACPKGPSRLERAKAKQQADKEDERKLRDWARRVKVRDEYTDRLIGGRAVKTAAAHPQRAEAHHIAGRADWDVRYDVRNGITVTWETHEAIESGKLEVIGTRFFTVNGKRYIDGTHPVKYKEHK